MSDKHTDALTCLWLRTRQLSLEERGFLFDLLITEAIRGADNPADDQGLSKLFAIPIRKIRRLSASLIRKEFTRRAGSSLAFLGTSPFENLKQMHIYKRQEVSPAARQEVYARDGFECVECGANQNLSCDHIIAVTSGGSNDIDNLRTLCRPCNSRKGAKSGRAA